jgi:PTS system mannose-specific IIB component
MIWFRIDNRLIHGQVIETWLPYTRATHLIVCNEMLSHDEMRQQIMILAVPSRIQVSFVSPASLPSLVESHNEDSDKVFVIFADCRDAKTAYAAGVRFSSLNIGNMHYAPGKRQVCEHVAMSEDDETCLRMFADTQVTLDFRCVPNETVDITDW